MLRLPLDLRTTWPLVGAALIAAVTGCAAAAPPAAQAPEPAPEVAIDRGPSFYEGDIGGMSQEAVEDTFRTMQRSIERCLGDGTSRVEALGGSLTISMRVNRAGMVKWAHAKSSTLGDRRTETCILDLVRAKQWPKPLSGEGLAEKTLDVEPGTPATLLEGKKVGPSAGVAKAKTQSCRKGIHGTFVATAYVTRTGEVVSAGVATPNENAETAADCIVDQIQHIRFSAAGKAAKGGVRPVTKVTFEI